MTKQDELDQMTNQLRAQIRANDAMIRRAMKEADSLCDAGDFKASADVRAIEARLRAAGAELTAAYAQGRMLFLSEGKGVVMPLSGGKD